MGAIIFLGLLIVYFLVSTVVVLFTVSWAKENRRSAWRWGLFSGFIMYNLVFWDWIPSAILQNYYCKTEAGFWLHKTPKEWTEENGVLPELEESKRNKNQSKNGYASFTHINTRLDSGYRRTILWPGIRREETILIDSKNGEILANEIYFECGACNRAPNSFDEYRFWLKQCTCAEGKRLANGGYTNAHKQYASITGGEN